MSHARGGNVGEGLNVGRKSSKRSRIVLGAAVASALAGLTASSVHAVDYTWNGNTSSFWDVNTNWSALSPGFPTGSDNATFGTSAARFIVDLHKDATLNPTGAQNVNNLTFSNTANSYNIGGGVLNFTGTITQSGNAVNTIGASLNGSGPVNVNAGTLRLTNTAPGGSGNNFNGQLISVGSGATLVGAGGSTPLSLSNALGNSTVSLANNSTLRASNNVQANQLLVNYYDTAVGPDTLVPIDSNAGLMTQPASGSALWTAPIRTSDQGQTGSDIRTVSGGIITDHDNFSVLWAGQLNVAAGKGGNWAFGTNSDDGSVVWIDLNNNGIFEQTSGELIVNNNFFQGPTARSGVVNLTAGKSYRMAIGWYEGGVTGEMTAGFQDPTTPGFNPNDQSLYTIVEPGNVAQAGLFSTPRYAGDYTTTNVTVAGAASSTVDVDGLSASFAELTMNPGSTLNVTGQGAASFSKTSGSGVITINAQQDVSTGVLNGPFTRINKTGPGQVSADNMNGPSQLTSSSVIAISQGKFLAKGDGGANTIRGSGGAATISLDGGTFVAKSTSAGAGLQETFIPGQAFGTGAITPSGTYTLGLPHANMAAVNTDPGPNAGWENNSTYAYTGKIFIKDNGVVGDGLGQIAFAENFDDNVLLRIDGQTILNNTDWATATGSGQVTLTTGWHDIDLRVGQGGGGVGASGPAQGNGFQNPLYGVVYDPQGRGLSPVLAHEGDYIFPEDPGDGSLFRDAGAQDVNFSDSNVNVTQNSAIDVWAPKATFGNLNVSAGKTLTITGLGAAAFNQTTASGGDLLIVTDYASNEISPGRLINGGGLTGVTKTGPGMITFDYNATASPLTSGMHINSTGGAVAGTHNGVNNPFGAAVINLTNSGLLLSATTTTPVNYGNTVNASGTYRVSAANHGAGAVDTGSVNLTALNAAAGSNVTVGVANGYSLNIGTINAPGNITLTNNSSDTAITYGTVAGGPTSVVTLNGLNRHRITGNVTANNVVVNAKGLDLEPTGTQTVAANTQLNTEMRIHAGVVDYGLNVINGVAVQAGLFEGRVSNVGLPDRNINKDASNPRTGVTLNLRRINQTNVNTDPGETAGWLTDSTYIYTGQIFIPDNDIVGDGLGKIAFGENFDDYTQVKVDGNLVIDDAAWNVATSSGAQILSAGWHDIEFRGGQGVGGVGPVDDATGWGGTKAIGIDFNAVGSVNGSDYVAPADNGTMNLFRTAVSTVNIDSGAELKVGGLSNVGVNLNGATGLSKLTIANHPTASNSTAVGINLRGAGAVGEVSVGSNTTLSAGDLVIDSTGSTFTKTGPGTLRVGGTNLQSPVTISEGKMSFNGVGNGPGGVTVKNGATIGGGGSIAGAVVVETGAHIAPHDAANGVSTLTMGALTNNPLAVLDFNFGTFGDSVNVLGNLELIGNSTLNIDTLAAPGFTVGTYRLFTMNTFTNTGDVVIGTNNGPAGFNYSIVETPTHIDLVVSATELKWTGATNNVWDINNTVNWVNGVPASAKYVDLNAVVFDNTGNNRTINITAPSVNPASILVNNDATHAYSIGGNPIGGATGILKQGVGTLTLTGANSFIGPVKVENGTLEVAQLANIGSPSSLGAGSVPVALGTATTPATLRYIGGGAGSTDLGIAIGDAGATVDTGAQNASFNGIASGIGTLTKTGAGKLSLGGAANTLSGSLNINAGTLSVASIGAGVAPAAINLGNGATYEWTGPTFTGGRNVTTPAAGAPGTISVTNAATNLTIGGTVSGGSLTKAGAGTLTLPGVVTFSGTSHSMGPNAGTLVYTGSTNTINGTYGVDAGSTLRTTTTTGLGTATIALNGGTLSLRAPATTPFGGMTAEFYHFGPAAAILDSIAAFDAALANNIGTKYATANTSTADNDPRPEVHGAINHGAGAGNPFDQYTDTNGNQVVTPDGNYENLVTKYTGKLNIGGGAAGLISFFTASDDGSKLWIDGVEVVNNNFFQGTTERGGSINLTEGVHDVVIGYYEGGGDAGMFWRWQPVGGVKEIVPNSALGVHVTGGEVSYANNVSTAPGVTSTIDASGAGTSRLNNLTLGNNSTLDVRNQGLSGSANVAFNSTTLGTAGGTYNLTGIYDMNLGQVNGSGTINRSGGGDMVLGTNNLAGLGAGSIINQNAGRLGAVGDAAKTNPLGQAAINLANGTSMIVGATAGDVTMNNAVNVTGTAGISSGIIGNATVGPHAMTLGSAARPTSLTAGGTLDLGANDGTSLILPAVQLAGSGTLRNSSSSDNVTIGSVSSPGVATFSGTKQMRLTGNITGATNVLVSNGALNVDPGAAGTSNISSPVKVVSLLNVKSGTTNVGNNIISGQKATSTVAGLNEYFANGAFYEGAIAGRPNTYNVPDSIQLEPRRANQAPGDTDGSPPGQGGNADVPGWTDNSTYIYSGQINIPDTGKLDGMGHVAFMMRFDDSISLKIDGQAVMRDTTWNNATSTGELVLSAGWHDIEMRFGEGGGGVGPNGNWTNQPPTNQFADGTFAAVGIQTDEALTFDPNSGFTGTGDFNGIDQTKYFAPRDDGTMNMFRVADLRDSGDVNVAAGATLIAGGVNDLQSLTLNGSNVNLSAASSHTGTSVLLHAAGAAGAVNNLNMSANNTLNTERMRVDEGTIFNKNGAGTLRIGAVHDFENDSDVRVNGGKLIVNSIGQTGLGTVSVASGATLGGKGTITGAASIASGGHVAPGDGVGTLGLGGLTLTSSLLDIEGSAAGVDKIKINSDGTSNVFSLTGNNIVTLSDLGGVAAGDYVLVDYNNLAPIANADSFFTISNPTGFAGLLASIVNDTANQDVVLRLTGPGGGGEAQWNVDASGSWGLASNWVPQSVPDSATAIASFLGKITAPRTVTLDGNRTVKNLNFDNANKYTIAGGSGGTLTINAGAVTVTSGSHEISAPIALTGAVTKGGAGTLTISGPQSNAAGSSLTVNAGIVNLNSNAGSAGSAASSPLALNITGSGARVNLGANQDLSALNVSGAGTQTLDLASPAGGGQFHSVTVYAANLTAAKAALYTALVNANAAGAVDPLDGITDSGLHANSKIGLAQSGDHISIRSTRIGDLNLDGNVTISDFIDLASNFGSTGGISTWQEGDLNYDRNVTISDFIDLAANFGASYSGDVVVSPSDVQTLASFASSVGVDPSIIGSAVPEPGTLSLLAIGAMGLMGRRRRKA